MVSNGSAHYDHDRDGTHTELAGCEAQFRKVPHDTYIAIRYEKKKLTVSTDIEGKNEWKQCFSVDGVRLPTGYYFGASAATGQLAGQIIYNVASDLLNAHPVCLLSIADNHDIISMKLYDIGLDNEKVCHCFVKVLYMIFLLV
jgi:mannose-binding lectin 2